MSPVAKILVHTFGASICIVIYDAGSCVWFVDVLVGVTLDAVWLALKFPTLQVAMNYSFL